MHRVDRTHTLALYTQLLEAWNKRSADDFAALFAPDGNAIGFDGSPMDGQQAIAAALGGVFANHQTATYVARVREIRRLGDAVMLLRAVVGMVPPGETTLNSAMNAVQSLVIVEHGDQPCIALLHNTPAAFHGRPELSEQLTEELTNVLRSGQVVGAG